MPYAHGASREPPPAGRRAGGSAHRVSSGSGAGRSSEQERGESESNKSNNNNHKSKVCGAARLAALSLLLAACDPAAAPDAAVPDGGADAGQDASVPLSASAAGPRYAVVGEEIELDGSGSTGGASYEWAFGDGRVAGPSADPVARVSYETPGRYRAVLTVRDAVGRRRTASWLVTVTEPLVHAPRQSASVAVDRETEQVAVVARTPDELAVFGFAGGTVSLVGATPRRTSRAPSRPGTGAGSWSARPAPPCSSSTRAATPRPPRSRCRRPAAPSARWRAGTSSSCPCRRRASSRGSTPRSRSRAPSPSRTHAASRSCPTIGSP
ncbi:MAG: PKD domain-containing protein [Sandaracinaceae bacterium]|nr:PKD domain-containing protein [Sandaracinaceae bacterium]